MNSDEFASPVEERYSLSASYPSEARNEGLTSKIRQTINATGKRVQTAHGRQSSTPDLTNLTSESQELILRTVDQITYEDSEQILNVLDESRDMFRNEFDEFKREQNEYRKQLADIARYREAAVSRRKENAIPLSMFMRQKRDVEGLADLRPNSGMNTKYQAYFEALLTTDKNQQQHPSDKAAVIKYIRRRERRRRADENRKHHQLTDDIIEQQKSEILGEKVGIDVKLARERQRQNDLLRSKINEKKIETQTLIEVTEIIDQAHEADLVRERVEQKQREKIEARVTEVRSRTPTNIIHVQTRDDGLDQLNDEQRSATQTSIQLLNDNDGYKLLRATTPIYGDDELNEKIADIHI